MPASCIAIPPTPATCHDGSRSRSAAMNAAACPSAEWSPVKTRSFLIIVRRVVPAYAPPCMTPIVLHHGLMGYGDLKLGPLKLAYFRGIDRAIIDRGHPLIISQVHPTGSIERRARELKEIILRQLKSLDREKEKVVIIGHSMGGLDARYMISRLGMDDRVAALVTITTPHRGSPYADWCLRHLGKRLGGLRLMNMIGWDMRAVSDLTTASCAT